MGTAVLAGTLWFHWRERQLAWGRGREQEWHWLEGVAPQFPSGLGTDPGHVWTCVLQVAFPPAGPTAEARPAELHVQTCSETALLAPDHPPLPPALRCPQAPQPGGMEAHEQGKCKRALGDGLPKQALSEAAL